MIGIRADANETIATGHVMRCIAIAQQFEKMKQEYIFITADMFTSDFLFERGYKSICLDSNWKDKDSELDKMIECIRSYNISKLIIDSYEVTKFYLDILIKYTKTVYIDDLYKFEYSVNILINYSPNVNCKKYNYCKKRNILTLLGNEFTPLREEFRNSSITIQDNVTDVLITTGGSDNLCVVEKILKRILEMKNFVGIKYHIIVGGFYSNIEELESIAEHNETIILYQYVKNMAEIMRKCDVAISAGGTTLAELCACGLPTICFSMADNQLEGIEIYSNRKIMISIGDIRENTDKSVDSILKNLEKLANNKELRECLSRNGKNCIDGNGARRISEAVIHIK
jgi:UDP-2,4-diacetamido-2,4,6-trideoxy-beta-L-altropyranose hydrolase